MMWINSLIFGMIDKLKQAVMEYVTPDLQQWTVAKWVMKPEYKVKLNDTYDSFDWMYGSNVNIKRPKASQLFQRSYQACYNTYLSKICPKLKHIRSHLSGALCMIVQVSKLVMYLSLIAEGSKILNFLKRFPHIMNEFSDDSSEATAHFCQRANSIDHSWWNLLRRS